MALPAYMPLRFRLWHYGFLFLCALIFLFLIAPILVIVPLSFNAGTYFTFSDAMLRLDPEAFSLRWYREIFDPPNRPGLQGNEWFTAAKNSLMIAIAASAQRRWSRERSCSGAPTGSDSPGGMITGCLSPVLPS